MPINSYRSLRVTLLMRKKFVFASIVNYAPVKVREEKSRKMKMVGKHAV